MNYLKRIRKNIRLEALGKGLIYGGIFAVLANMALMFMRVDTHFWVSIVLTLCSLLAAVFVSMIASLRRLNALSRRAASLEKISGSMDSDSIHRVSEDTLMGNTWLIIKRKTDYRLWTKNILNSVRLESNNPKAKQAILELTMRNGRTEKVIVRKSPVLESALAEWFAPVGEESEIKVESE